MGVLAVSLWPVYGQLGLILHGEGQWYGILGDKME